MTREEVRAETDKLVDAAVKAGNEAGNDPFEVGLVNQVFRPYVHMLDDAQMLQLDPDGVRACVIAHLANLVKVLMQRTIEKSDVVSAQSIGNEIITKLAQYMVQDLNEWFKAGKPH